MSLRLLPTFVHLDNVRLGIQRLCIRQRFKTQRNCGFANGQNNRVQYSIQRSSLPFPKHSNASQISGGIEMKTAFKGQCFKRALYSMVPLAAYHDRKGRVKNPSCMHKAQFSAKAIVDASPPGIQPYLQLSRIDKPIGTWLVYLPSTWSIAMAAPHGAFPDFMMLGLFGVGALLMRGAGCTVNDIIDKDIDKQVARTNDRPLACGQLTDFQALCFLGVQLSAALIILLSFDWHSIVLGSSCVLLMVTYPLMKRVTFWPQIFLGLTLNWGILLGWSVVHGSCDWAMCLPLYAAGVLHTIIYDTIYAHGDKEDDIKAGVKSTALYMGNSTKIWLGSFTAAMGTSLCLSGYLIDQTLPYYIGVTTIVAHLSNQLYSVNLDDPQDCAKKFRSNRHIGMILFAAIVFGNLLKSKPSKETQPKEMEV